MIAPMNVTVRENAERHRYEAVGAEGAVAGFLEYVDHRGTRVLFHTEVDPAIEERGIGSTLAREALDQALASGLSLRVTCPFLVEWIGRHPDYADKVTLG